VLEGDIMIKKKADGTIDAALLDDTGCLSEKIMKSYDYMEMKRDFEDILNTLYLNQMSNAFYKESLQYSVNDDLEFIVTCSDPRNDKNDIQIMTLDRTIYDNSYIVCEELLHKVKDAWNNLNEVERYILKCLYFDNPKIPDEEIIELLATYKNKFNLMKRSAYTKMNVILNSNSPLLRADLNQTLKNCCKIITIQDFMENSTHK